MAKSKQATQKTSSAAPQAAKLPDHFPIVGIGASAGGMEAFVEFLKHLPARTGMAFIYVQHQEPKHESSLVDILSRVSNLPVVPVTDRMKIEPNRVHVMPGAQDMGIHRHLLYLQARGGNRGVHTPIDTFFKSLADDSGERAIGIILSGAGSDGTAGLEAIRGAGGITFAQTPDSAKYDSMPRNAIQSGCVDFVLPPSEIAHELSSVATKLSRRQEKARETPSAVDVEKYKPLFVLLQKNYGVDFSQYKLTTIMRRLTRRMVLRKTDTIDEYMNYINRNPRELESLYDEMLIHVTNFFRDPEIFDILKAEIFPKLLRKQETSNIRIWVPGCSSGEECYSLAIAIFEYLGAEASTIKLQIFGTDISNRAIQQARSGAYPESIAADVSPERLRRFFQKSDRGYEISKSIRDICVFARHNVIKDPPFSKMDIISCRNLLIYLGPLLQKRVMPVFHYALNPGGYLILGSSESIGPFSDFFYAADKKHKIYARRSVPGKVHFDVYGHFPSEYLTAPADRMPRPGTLPVLPDALKEGDRLILSRYAPPAVVINDELEVLQFRGRVSPFLEPPQGQATFQLLKMAREGLMVELRAAVQAAKREKKAVRKDGLHVNENGKRVEFGLEVIPFGVGRAAENFYLVLFDRVSPPEIKTKRPKELPKKKDSAESREADLVRQELQATKEYLQSIIEEQEAVNEELKAANEEILSSNEELQSTNEELETAKEELQSANEELTTLNEELQNRNSELNSLNNDMSNLLASVQIPVIILGPDLRIRRFTPSAEKALNLLPTDVGRPITDINLNLYVTDLERMIVDAVDNVTVREKEVKDRKESWFRLQVRPYKTTDNKIDGAVLVLFDIDEWKKKSIELTRYANYSEAVLNFIQHPLLILDNELRIQAANRQFYEKFGLSKVNTESKKLSEAGDGQLQNARLRGFVEGLRDGKVEREAIRLDHHDSDGKKAPMQVTGRLLEINKQKIIVLAFQPGK